MNTKSYRVLFAVLALTLTVSACSKSGSENTEATPEAAPKAALEPAAPAEAAPAPAEEPKPFDATQAFNTTCATCHGTSGHGDGPAGQALDPKPASFADADFWKTRDRDSVIKVITEGGAAVGKSPLMVSFKAQFTPEQIEALADHVLSYKPQ
ncbi:MAG: cytochrome c [Polyangiales bacterium]